MSFFRAWWWNRGRLASERRNRQNQGMNEESLTRANSILAAAAGRVPPGELLDASPTDLGKGVGIGEPLAVARAVRALLARRRLEVADEGYRLLDARPLQPGEPESIPRQPRKRKKEGTRGKRAPATYSDVGHVAIERLIELGREVATLRAAARVAREEVRISKRAKEEAEAQASSLSARIYDLEAKLEMAEQNLRAVLAAAKGREETLSETGEMEAILGVLKASSRRPMA